MARDKPGIDVVAAAGRIAHHQGKRLALIEIIGTSGSGHAGEHGKHEGGQARDDHELPTSMLQARFKAADLQRPGPQFYRTAALSCNMHAAAAALPELQDLSGKNLLRMRRSRCTTRSARGEHDAERGCSGGGKFPPL